VREGDMSERERQTRSGNNSFLRTARLCNIIGISFFLPLPHPITPLFLPHAPSLSCQVAQKTRKERTQELPA